VNEIFSNDLSQLRLSVTVQGEPTAPTALPTAQLYVSNDIKFDVAPVTLTVTPDVSEDAPVGRYLIPVPLASVQEKRYAKVVYTYNLAGFGTITKEEFFEIRTRLLPYDELISMTGDPDLTYDAFALAEAEVRMIIEGFTRQRFSKWTGQLTITTNPNRLYLPQFLRELTSVAEYDDYDMPLENTDFRLEEGGLVIGRETKALRDAGPKKFNVIGKWGYISVPDNVKKAAYELIRDFTSAAINKRRQYLLNAGGQGLGATFNDSVDLISWRAYMDSTGNSVADQLLMNYRVLRPGII